MANQPKSRRDKLWDAELARQVSPLGLGKKCRVCCEQEQASAESDLHKLDKIFYEKVSG
jgi:hypothetical protein